MSIEADSHQSTLQPLETSWFNHLGSEGEKDERIFDMDIPLAERCLIHLSTRMLFHEDFMPLAASVGGHLADLQQAMPAEDDEHGIPGGKGMPFYFKKRQPASLVIPVCLVQPAGYGKSMSMKQWFGRYGICPINYMTEGSLTEASFVAKQDGKEVQWGTAWLVKDGFCIFNEISNVFIASATKHSGGLSNQVMEALSERHVCKSTVKVEYDTNITIWGGVQPGRFDFQAKAGAGRRFIYIAKRWTDEEIQLLKQDELNELLNPDEYPPINTAEVMQLRKEMRGLLDNGCIEKKPKWDESLARFIYSNNVTKTHLDADMLVRAMIGVAYLNHEPGDKQLKIENTPFMRLMLDKIIRSSRMVAEGGDVSLLMSTIGEDTMTYSQIWTMFNRFQYQLEDFNSLLNKAHRNKIINKEFSKSRQQYLYSVNPNVRGKMPMVDAKSVLGVRKVA